MVEEEFVLTNVNNCLTSVFACVINDLDLISKKQDDPFSIDHYHICSFHTL